MKANEVVVAIAMLCILILAITALLCGQNGVVLTGATTAIAGLGGYSIGKRKKGGKNNDTR